MLIALTQNEERIDIHSAKPDEKYICPLCKKDLKIQTHKFYANQFKHVIPAKCDIFERTITKHNQLWQEQFHIGNREVLVGRKPNKHKAPIKLGKTVIIPCTLPLSRKEFNDETDFYEQAGYKVIWIFDMIAFAKGKHIIDVSIRNKGRNSETDWHWKHPRNFLQNYNPENENVIVLFQFYESNLEDYNCEKYLERVIDLDAKGTKSNLNHFTTVNYPGTKTELLYTIKEDKLQYGGKMNV